MPSSPRAAIRMEIHGVDLPGRSCGPRPGGGHYDDIHLGLKRGPDAIELVPGDAPEARWALDVAVRNTPAGRDFGGPFVGGHRDDRHLGLRLVRPRAGRRHRERQTGAACLGSNYGNRGQSWPAVRRLWRLRLACQARGRPAATRSVMAAASGATVEG